MRKFMKFCGFCLLLLGLFWLGSILSDRKTLDTELIRFHVLANSDSAEDQQIKLQLRDVMTQALQKPMSQCVDAAEADKYLSDHLASIEALANAALTQMGVEDKAAVSFDQEYYPTRHYDTISLPAGIYRSLRITIGDGKGENWWCVVFPSLCLPAATEDFQAAAVDSGFPRSLAGALDRDPDYEVRFFFLDCIGRLRNFFQTG